MKKSEFKKRIEEIEGKPFDDEIQIVTDTTNFTDIERNMVLDLQGEYYLVRGNMEESRFTLKGFPKFWVKNTIELATGIKKIVKCVFNEEFVIKIGPLSIKCFRSPRKEGEVLELVKDNPYFMHGRTLYDAMGNPVRILDYIRGDTIYEYLINLQMNHKEYFFSVFPTVLLNLRTTLTAIKYIHDHGYYHGDIRNDHIIIEENTGTYRWIDYDLNQHFSDFDVWSLGNILLFTTGKGEHSFNGIIKNKEVPEKNRNELCEDDASAFFRYRIINLRKIFPYIPKKLNDILMHFSLNTTVFYDKVDQIIDDVDEVLEELEVNTDGTN